MQEFTIGPSTRYKYPMIHIIYQVHDERSNNAHDFRVVR